MCRHLHSLAKSFKSERFGSISLRRSSIYRRYSDIIHIKSISRLDIFEVFHRKTYDLVRPQQSSCIFIGHVALSDMDSVSIHCKGHIHSVIDDQRDIKRFEQFHESAGQFNEFSCRRVLFSQLHDSNSAFDSFRNDLFQRPAQRQFPVCHQIQFQIILHILKSLGSQVIEFVKEVHLHRSVATCIDCGSFAGKAHDCHSCGCCNHRV